MSSDCIIALMEFDFTQPLNTLDYRQVSDLSYRAEGLGSEEEINAWLTDYIPLYGGVPGISWPHFEIIDRL